MRPTWYINFRSVAETHNPGDLAQCYNFGCPGDGKAITAMLFTMNEKWSLAARGIISLTRAISALRNYEKIQIGPKIS